MVTVFYSSTASDGNSAGVITTLAVATVLAMGTMPAMVTIAKEKGDLKEFGNYQEIELLEIQHNICTASECVFVASQSEVIIHV